MMSSSVDEKEKENEGDGFSKAVIRRKLLSTPLEVAKDDKGDIEEVAIKRKHGVRSTGFQECLLEFEEFSGVAKFVKTDVANDYTDQHVAEEDDAIEHVGEPSKSLEDSK